MMGYFALVSIFATVVAALVGYFVYDTLNATFKAYQASMNGHLTAVSKRMIELEKSLKEAEEKIRVFDESNGQMMKTMLDAEENGSYKLDSLREDFERALGESQDEVFAVKSTLEALGESVGKKSQNKKKTKKTGKRA